MVERYFTGLFLTLVFLGTFLVELYMLTFWMGKPNLTISPVIWLITGILNAWTGSVLIARMVPELWMSRVQSGFCR
jgi:hypothetical protein